MPREERTDTCAQGGRYGWRHYRLYRRCRRYRNASYDSRAGTRQCDCIDVAHVSTHMSAAAFVYADWRHVVKPL